VAANSLHEVQDGNQSNENENEVEPARVPHGLCCGGHIRYAAVRDGHDRRVLRWGRRLLLRIGMLGRYPGPRHLQAVEDAMTIRLRTKVLATAVIMLGGTTLSWATPARASVNPPVYCCYAGTGASCCGSVCYAWDTGCWAHI
jgi:hypothetical protein